MAASNRISQEEGCRSSVLSFSPGDGLRFPRGRFAILQRRGCRVAKARRVAKGTKDRWIPTKDNYLFKITSLAKEFRNRYLQLLLKAYLKEQLIFTQKTAALNSKQAFQQLIRTNFSINIEYLQQSDNF